MRKINSVITVCLSVLALIVWGYAFYQAVTVRTGILFSLHFYPALFAVALSAAACLGWVMVTRQYARGDGETRCRKCRYILRGLSEPVCPECGTRI